MPTVTVAAPGAAPAKQPVHQPKQLPPPNSDFYQLVDVLTAEEKAMVKKVRTYMETKVQPVINKYWSDDAFPFELLPSFKELGIYGLGFEGYGCPGGSQKLFGFVAMELARVDASLGTFFGVHSGLAMGSIYLDGSLAALPGRLDELLDLVGCQVFALAQLGIDRSEWHCPVLACWRDQPELGFCLHFATSAAIDLPDNGHLPVKLTNEFSESETVLIDLWAIRLGPFRPRSLRSEALVFNRFSLSSLRWRRLNDLAPDLLSLFAFAVLRFRKTTTYGV